jgi:phage tail-like protein
MANQKYPLPRFYFAVSWNGKPMTFSEVTGLAMERDKIEYRHGDSSDFGKLVMPGLIKNSHATFKRGKFEGDTTLQDLYRDMAHNPEARVDINVSLMNEQQQPVASWTVRRCVAVKITIPDLKSDANEVAVESIEVAHEGIVPA